MSSLTDSLPAGVIILPSGEGRHYPCGPMQSTNPDRFSPLHSFVMDLLARLEAEFNVTRVEGYGIDAELEARGVVRPTVKLAPSDAGAAPITVAFGAFPGLAVRSGRWKLDFFPGCGCDACDETAEGESDRIQEQVDSLVAGQFREAIVLPFFGTGEERMGIRVIRPAVVGRMGADRSIACAIPDRRRAAGDRVEQMVAEMIRDGPCLPRADSP